MSGKDPYRPVLIGIFSLILSVGSLRAEQASNFALPDITGQRTVLFPYLETMQSNSFLVINFTGSSCKPCKMEVPRLLKVLNKINSKKPLKIHLWLVFVGDDAQTATRVAAELKISGEARVLYDLLEGSYSRFRFSGIPHTTVISPEGQIMYSENGYNDEKFSKLAEFLEGL